MSTGAKAKSGRKRQRDGFRAWQERQRASKAGRKRSRINTSDVSGIDGTKRREKHPIAHSIVCRELLTQSIYMGDPSPSSNWRLVKMLSNQCQSRTERMLTSSNSLSPFLSSRGSLYLKYKKRAFNLLLQQQAKVMENRQNRYWQKYVARPGNRYSLLCGRSLES